MNGIELVGGPLDGACTENRGGLVEGDHVVVEPEDSPRAIYTFHNGMLEFDPELTFGRDAA